MINSLLFYFESVIKEEGRRKKEEGRRKKKYSVNS
jgi:hypothetical protein